MSTVNKQKWIDTIDVLMKTAFPLWPYASLCGLAKGTEQYTPSGVPDHLLLHPHTIKLLLTKKLRLYKPENGVRCPIIHMALRVH